jgi:hypothetical protein
LFAKTYSHSKNMSSTNIHYSLFARWENLAVGVTSGVACYAFSGKSWKGAAIVGVVAALANIASAYIFSPPPPYSSS